MIEVEVRCSADAVNTDAMVRVIEAVCAELGIADATVGLMVVDAGAMAELNRAHRGKDGPTDVLSFPVDGPDVAAGWDPDGPPPELGDIVICPEASLDPLPTLAVHGLLHLLGYDHEVDGGEMLALQDDLVGRLT